MNYKIKITAENREAIKDIAERNGMNPTNKKFNEFGWYYTIECNFFNDLFSEHENNPKRAFKELTFDQFKQMFDKQETDLDKWQPKRGDRVLVWGDDQTKCEERIFLAEIKGSKYPFIVVYKGYETEFINGEIFLINAYSNMKPLPKEEPTTEKTYKDKVIELIEEKIKDYQKSENEYSSLKAHFQAQTYKDQAFAISQLLKQIKELN